MGCNVDKFELILGIERKPEDGTMVHVQVAKQRTKGPRVKIVNGHAIVVRDEGVYDESRDSSGSGA